MKLIGEQVKALQIRKEDIQRRKKTYKEYVTQRERFRIENLGNMAGDYNEDMQHAMSIKDETVIDRLLSSYDYVMNRDFEKMDIGTAAIIEFPKANRSKQRRIILTDANSPSISLQTVSINSDFGSAVQGREEGEEFEYTVQATNRKILAKIVEIDKDIKNYEYFIREIPSTKRMANKSEEELRRLKELDIEEYNKRHQITISQRNLVLSELYKLNSKENNISVARRKSFYNKLLDEDILLPPNDDTIGVGSIVTILLVDKEGNDNTLTFELINRAVAAELASSYVERTSSLGQVIYGLKEGDNFKLRRCHKPAYCGTIINVSNLNSKVYQRTK